MRKFTYIVENRRSDKVEILSIEPWADEITLAPGSKAKIEIFYQDEGPLEVVLGNGIQSIWPWKTSYARVIVDDDEEGAITLD